MFEILLHYIIFLIIIFSNGLVFHKIFLNNGYIKLNFFEQSIIGLIATGFLAVIINFFFPLNDLIIYINFVISCFFLFIYKNQLFFKYNKLEKTTIIIILILSLVNIYGSGYSDDLHHYHGGYIVNTDNHNYIIGSNFLNNHFGYSSIWLILHSYLNINSFLLQDIHVLNAILFFLIISYLVTENLQKKKSNFYFLYLASSIFIFFFLIKYTRLKEFGLDRPGILLFCFLIYFAAKYQYLLNKKPNEINKYFFLIFFICLFITYIKIFFLFCLLIPLFLIFKLKFNNFFYSKFALVIYFVVGVYFLKNILISGCLIYPFEFTCFANLDWNTKEIASNLLLKTEASTKGFDKYILPLEFKQHLHALNASEYVKNFNWVSIWLARNTEELINYFSTIIIILFLFIFGSQYNKKIKKYDSFEIIIFFLFIFNLIIFIKSPVVRYHHTLFIFFGLSLMLSSKIIFLKKTMIFNWILILCLCFNFSKNLLRIYKTDFYNNPYEHIKKVKWYISPVEKKLGSFIYYEGWIDAHPVGNMDISHDYIPMDRKSTEIYNYLYFKHIKHKKKFIFDMIYR